MVVLGRGSDSGRSTTELGKCGSPRRSPDFCPSSGIHRQAAEFTAFFETDFRQKRLNRKNSLRFSLLAGNSGSPGDPWRVPPGGGGGRPKKIAEGGGPVV